MCDLLNQINDDDFEPVVTVTDTTGKTGKYEFLDIVNYRNLEYAVLCPVKGDGYVEIFLIENQNGKESYSPVSDEELLENVFELFRIKNEDEFDFI